MNEISKAADEKPIWLLLLNSAQRVEARLEAELAATGLSLSKLTILDQLVRSGEPLPLSRLADRLACVKSNVTQLVDRLENDGFVKRLSDPKDRRSILASITREGRERHAAGSAALAKFEADVFGHLDERARKTLRDLVGPLAAGSGCPGS